MTTSARPHTESREATGCYLYGIAPADIEVDEDVRGVGDPPATVRVLRQDGISAVVSDVAVDRPLGRPDDLTAHQNVLDMIAAVAPVLPARFGSVVDGDSAIAESVLREHHDAIAKALTDLEGHAEYVVHGRYVDDVAVREVLRENPEADRLRQAIGDQPEEETREARIRLGEFINQAIEAKRQADTQTMLDGLQPLTASVVVRDASHEDDAVYLAVLARTEARDDLEKTLEEYAQRWRDRIELRLIGPMAAYDFAALPTG